MAADDRPALMQALAALAAWFRTESIAGVVIGGVAVSALSRARFTRDVDALVLVEEDQWDAFLGGAERHGFTPRVADVLSFARRARVLLLRHAATGVDVDISFGILPFEREAVARAGWRELMGTTVPLPRPEDLVILKAVAHRPQDMADIAALLEAHPRINRRRVRRLVGEFSDALESPELLTDLEQLLHRPRQGRRRPRRE